MIVTFKGWQGIVFVLVVALLVWCFTHNAQMSLAVVLLGMMVLGIIIYQNERKTK